MGSASRDVLLDGRRSAHAISDAVSLSGKSEYDGGPLGYWEGLGLTLTWTTTIAPPEPP